MDDKDGDFLDAVEEALHESWMRGDVTNTFRNHFIETIKTERDWL